MKLILIILLYALLCSCSSEDLCDFEVTGNLKNLDGSILTLRYGDKEYARDTVRNACFIVKAKLPNHAYCTVHILGAVPKGGKIWGKLAKDFVGGRDFFVERGASYKWVANGHDDFFTEKDTVISTSKNQQDLDHLVWLKNRHWEMVGRKKVQLGLKRDGYLAKDDLTNYKIYSDSIALMFTNPPSVRNVINKFLNERPNTYTAIYTLATSRSLKQDLAFFNTVYARMDRELKNSSYGREYKVKADQMRKMLANEKFRVDIQARDKTGRLFDLDDFQKYQLIYVDIRASWCMPCLEQMPASKKMQQELERQNVAYMYLSIDEPTTSKAWEKENTSLKLKWSYLLDSATNKAFQNQLVVENIPRYFIINTKGELLEKDAPGPDKPERLKALLNKLKLN